MEALRAEMLERDRPAGSKSRSSPRDDKVVIDPIDSIYFIFLVHKLLYRYGFMLNLS